MTRLVFLVLVLALVVPALDVTTARSDGPSRPLATELRVAPAYRAEVEEVVAAIHDIGVPLPSEIGVYVHESQSAFRHGLLEEAYVPLDRVEEIAAFAAGLARPGRVLLHAKAVRGRREWRRLIAHELTHVGQFTLAGGDGRADQWLAEGVAERVAFQVLERLGLDSLADRRQRALGGAVRHPGFAAGRLDLAALGSPREFTLRHQRDGSLETYQLTFLMADYLVEQKGLHTVLDYFRRCRRLDRGAAFAGVFGKTVQEFEAEILAHLRAAHR
jgi:hypothetical protein